MSVIPTEKPGTSLSRAFLYALQVVLVAQRVRLVQGTDFRPQQAAQITELDNGMQNKFSSI